MACGRCHADVKCDIAEARSEAVKLNLLKCALAMSEGAGAGAGPGAAGDRLERLRAQHRAARKERQELEIELFELKRKEEVAVDELNREAKQISAYDEELVEVNKVIVKLQNQMSNVEVCNIMEQVKIDARLKAIEDHKQQFTDLYAKEREQAEIRHKELQEKENGEIERERVKCAEIAKNYEKEVEEAVSVEAECEQLEKECIILKKRNNAVLLLMRKNLFDAETKRRSLLKLTSTEN